MLKAGFLECGALLCSAGFFSSSIDRLFSLFINLSRSRIQCLVLLFPFCLVILVICNFLCFFVVFCKFLLFVCPSVGVGDLFANGRAQLAKGPVRGLIAITAGNGNPVSLNTVTNDTVVVRISHL